MAPDKRAVSVCLYYPLPVSLGSVLGAGIKSHAACVPNEAFG